MAINRTNTTLFNKFQISKADLKLYESIIASATTFEEMEQIINHFMSNYIIKMDKAFTSMIQDILNVSLSTELINVELKNTENLFMLSSSVYEDVMKSNYKIVSEMVVQSSMNFIGGNKKLQKMLSDKLIGEFNQRISGAMANTRTDVLQYVRTLQREMIIRNQQLAFMEKKGVMDATIEYEKSLFRQNMLNKYPQLQKMLDNGDVLKSRSWVDKDGNQKFRTYTLDEYNEMATSETLKNVDRDAVEMISTYYNEPVVEFYLRDNRKVETPNDACAYIMKNKILGKALLATSESVAKTLGIWSINKAKASHSLNISFHCRHSIKRASDEIINKVNKVLNIANVTDQVHEVK